MTIVLSSSLGEMTFNNKDVINVGTHPNCDFKLNVPYDLLLTLQIDNATGTVVLVNTFQNPNVLFKGTPIKRIKIENIGKILIKDTNEFLMVKILPAEQNTAPTQQPVQQQIQQPVQPQAINKPQSAIPTPPPSKTISTIAKEEFTEDDLKGLYGNDANAATRIKIEQRKSEIERARVPIIKEVSYLINDLKQKISAGHKATVFLHIALAVACLICSFGVSNYLLGLKVVDSGNILHLPTNMKVMVVYTIMLYGISLILKQGVFLSLQGKTGKTLPPTAKIAETAMLTLSAFFVVAIYAINVIYYTASYGTPVLPIFISLFFVGLMTILAMGCGYFKHDTTINSQELDKYEYRPDFEAVTKDYQQWIERFINSLSKSKIQYIKDKVFNLQLKSIGEMCLGVVTAPFLAYGVSNTLAMCFPEAAGWIRVSGLRFSPVFLTLATFLIIFAFFMFVNAFLCVKKIQASQVIKQDGFSDYQQHGVSIYGIEAVRKLNSDKMRSLAIACSIIFIEFSMNISFFMGEIGGDLQGLFLSLIAALVPTALLIAETYMLSQTKFDIYVCEDVISKVDKY